MPLSIENLYSSDKVHMVAKHENKSNIKLTNLTINNQLSLGNTILHPILYHFQVIADYWSNFHC